METVFRELRFGLRSLTKSPGFAAVAIATLALGIGASTAIFSVVDAVLLRPLPYPKPEQIVRVWEQAPDGHPMRLADPNFDDFRMQNHTFSALAEYAGWPQTVSGGSEPLRAGVATVSRDFFKALAVEPFRGRTFRAEEQRVGGAPAAVVSNNFWQRSLGGTTDFSQLHLRIEGEVYSVVGVMPAGFDFPDRVAAWIPRERIPEITSRTAHNWHAVGRLRDGVTIGQARADLSTIARNIHQKYGKNVDLADATVLPLAQAMVGDVRTALLTLLGAVILLLLVGCANVAGLLLARTSSRRKELAVRTALGAGRGRLVQQFLAESAVLAFAGGLFGVLLATWAVKAIPAIMPTNLPRQQEIAISPAVVFFALGVTLAIAVSLGVFSAWRAASGDLQQALTAGSRSYSGGAASQRLRGFVVIGEIAATLVILIGAGLLARSFVRLVSTSPGFRSENLITIQFSPPAATGDAAAARQVQFVDQLLARLRAIPGAESAAYVDALPTAAGDNLANGSFLILDGRKAPADFDEFGRRIQDPQQAGDAFYLRVGDGFFRTMGIPLLRGRAFSERDVRDGQHVAVISESLARERWPDEDPIGKELFFGNMDGVMKPFTVVGIAGDIRARGLDRSATPMIYGDYLQRGADSDSSVIIVRSTASPAAILSTARGIFHDLAPDVPVKFSTFDQEMGGWLASRRFLLLLVGLFAAAALALAALGIYGVVAFSVTRRTQEIGIRMALGARTADVLRLVLGEGARMAAVGVVIGIVLSLAVTRLMASLLFGVRPSDPATFAVVAVLLTLVALLASYVPARRATRVSPETALRYE